MSNLDPKRDTAVQLARQLTSSHWKLSEWLREFKDSHPDKSRIDAAWGDYRRSVGILSESTGIAFLFFSSETITVLREYVNELDHAGTELARLVHDSRIMPGVEIALNSALEQLKNDLAGK